MAKKKEEIGNLDDMVAALNQKCGNHTMFYGTDPTAKDPDRVPSGIFSVDFSSGGGIPIWGSACYWGGNSVGKTALALNNAAMTTKICWRCFQFLDFCTCSQNSLLMRTAWADAEGTLNIPWAANIGVDTDKLAVIMGDSGEQYVDICRSVLQADDLGLLVIDSLAALSPSAEMESSSEDSFYALQARLIGRMVRNLKQQIIRERKREHPCAIIFINQMRSKIGVLFGSPDTMSGGNGMMHEFSLLIRCNKIALSSDDKAKYTNTERKKQIGVRHSFSIKKNKVFTIAGSGEYVRVTESLPEFGLKAGQIDDYSTVMKYAKECGIVRKPQKGTGWKYFNYKAKTLGDIVQVWKTKPNEYLKTQKAIIDITKEKIKNAKC